MRLQSALSVAMSASAALALTIPLRDIQTPSSTVEALFRVEVAPGKTHQVTEAQKFEMISNGIKFIDITNYQEFNGPSQTQDFASAAVAFPSAVAQKDQVTPLLAKLNINNLETTLTTFSNFYNRYYKSDYGRQSSEWLLSQIQAIITASGATNATVKPFKHTWVQSSIIATIPGQSANTIVIGAHQDSINLNSPSTGRAPGADDDGSGTVTILEAFRVLLSDSRVASGQAPNTIEFHWYSAEEGGLLGSQAIFQDYKRKGRVVKAMLQQDMTGYVKPGTTESVGVITDYVDAGLTGFVKKVIPAYCAIPFVETKCGYACSDHASASKAGYPSAFVIEAAMDDTSKFIHTTQDTLSTVSYKHMMEHAKMTVGVAYELAFATTL